MSNWVIDAKRLAEKIDYQYDCWHEADNEEGPPCPGIRMPEIAQLITDNMDLDIKWGKQGQADWGIFYLSVENCFDDINSKRWSWYLQLSGVIKNGIAESQELAQQACEKALRRIITGVKEIDTDG